MFSFLIPFLVWFGLVWFIGISTLVDYLMPNPVYSYISNQIYMICIHFVNNIFKQP